MDRLGEIRRGGRDDDPDWGRVPTESRVPARASVGRRRDERRQRQLPRRSPEVEDDNEVFVPPFLGSRVVKGIALDDIAAYVNETALFRNQWQFRPEARRETTTRSRRASARCCATQLAEAKSRRCWCSRRSSTATSPCNGDGNDLVIWEDESRDRRGRRASRSRGQHEAAVPLHRRLLPPDRVDRGRLRRVPHRDDGRSRVASAPRSCSPTNRYQDYLLLHGLGVEMAEALAEYWHRRIREEWGFADEDGPTLAGLFRQQYRGGRYSWGYPACPDLEDNAKVAELLDARTHRPRGAARRRRSSTSPEQTTSAIICHHPQGEVLRRPLTAAVRRDRSGAREVRTGAAGPGESSPSAPEQVAERVDAVEHVGGLERQRLRRRGRVDLVPRHRRRHRRARAGPQRVRADRRLVAGVLAPVDEDLALAQLPCSCSTRTTVAVVLLHRLGDGRARTAAPARGWRRLVDRHVELQALRARRLGEALRGRGRRARRGSTGRPRRSRRCLRARRGRGRTRPSPASRCRRTAPSARAARARRGWRPTRPTARPSSRQ